MKYLLVQACRPESNPQNAWKEGRKGERVGRQAIRRRGGDKKTKEGKKERGTLAFVVVEKGRFYHSEASQHNIPGQLQVPESPYLKCS